MDDKHELVKLGGEYLGAKYLGLGPEGQRHLVGKLIFNTVSLVRETADPVERKVLVESCKALVGAFRRTVRQGQITR